MENQPVYYADYLQLNKILDAQLLLSKKFGDEKHEEMLFIITHQAYELWFKQIIHELDFITQSFNKPNIAESSVLNCVSKLNRIIKIQSVLINTFSIIETMTPMEFLEFRDLLMPASGFQSMQFRKVELKLGLDIDSRPSYARAFFIEKFNESEKNEILQIMNQPSLFTLVEKWLERIPFIRTNDFNFWIEYKKSVDQILSNEKDIILKTQAKGNLPSEMNNFEATKLSFEELFDGDKYKLAQSQGKRKISQRAFLSALFIFLYRDEPILNGPFQFLSALLELDNGFTTWRQRHALLAQKMLGTKIGTGGSSGHEYLKNAAESSKVFKDFFDLPTFLIPASKLPQLPEKLKKELGFHFNT